MDLESATAQLYAGSPDGFVERRKSLASEARAAKDRALATAIGKLRRPTRSAWLVNLYARQAPEELGALLDLGAALQAAQEQLSAPDLRRLSAERHRTLDAATRRAVALGAEQGYTATEPVRQEVTQTLQAALADAEIAAQVRAGTVVEAHAYGGFGPFGLADLPAASAPTAEPAVTRADAEQAIPAEQVPDRGREEAERRAAAEQRLQQAEADLSAAADGAEEATALADEFADRVERLRAELADAESAEVEARATARAARKRVAEVEEIVRTAREAYESL